MLQYQNQCPGYFLHVGPELRREFWKAGDTVEMNIPAGTSRRQTGKKTKEETESAGMQEGAGEREAGEGESSAQDLLIASSRDS